MHKIYKIEQKQQSSAKQQSLVLKGVERKRKYQDLASAGTTQHPVGRSNDNLFMTDYFSSLTAWR
jgi:hypothetical protein